MPRDRLGRGVAVLAAEWEGKATLLVTVTADLVESKTLHAGNLVKAIAAAAGGRGGGRPNTAQAGCPTWRPSTRPLRPRRTSSGNISPEISHKSISAGRLRPPFSWGISLK